MRLRNVRRCISRFLIIALCALPLAACISGVKPPDTYTDRNGKTTVFRTDRDACQQSCNDDYSRCMDSDAAENSGVNGPAGMFGGSASCSRDLKSCMADCNGR